MIKGLTGQIYLIKYYLQKEIHGRTDTPAVLQGKSPGIKEEKTMVKKINAEQFTTEACASDVAVVDFSATWCGPCRMLAPVLEELSEKLAGKADFYNLDVDDAPEIAAQYQVQSIPCVVLLKKGELKDQSIGFRPGAQLQAWIESNL